MKFGLTQGLCIGATIVSVFGVSMMGFGMVEKLQAQSLSQVQEVSSQAQNTVIRLTEAANALQEKTDADQDAKMQQMIDDVIAQFAEEQAQKLREEAAASGETEDSGVTAGANTGEPGFNEP